MANPRSCKRKHIIEWSIVGIILILLGLSLYPVYQQATAPTHHPVSSLEEAEKLTHVHFPPSARLLGSEMQPAGLDYTIFATVTITKAELPQFLKYAISGKPLSLTPNFDPGFEKLADGTVIESTGTSEPKAKQHDKWWNYRKVPNLKGTRIQLPPDEEILIMIDDRSERATVYVLGMFY